MSCEHAETTTLLWLYGELDPELQDEHLRHIGSCEACTAVVAEHEQVVAAVAPIAPALRQVGATPTPIRPANRPMLAAVFVLAAAAAAAALVILLPGPESAAPLDTDVAVALDTDLGVVDPPLFGEVDGDLQELDWELVDLTYDLGTL